MTPEQLELVQASYAALGADAPAMAADFYRRLFALDPATEALFTNEPAVMAEKFANELAAIVQAITSYDEFAVRVHGLAARHIAYGVQTRHFSSVGEALVGALAAHLAPSWDADVEAAWRRAYNLVAEMMMATAAELATGTPPGHRPGVEL
jgi:hemoglobin-like flavoprotein